MFELSEGMVVAGVFIILSVLQGYVKMSVLTNDNTIKEADILVDKTLHKTIHYPPVDYYIDAVGMCTID